MSACKQLAMFKTIKTVETAFAIYLGKQKKIFTFFTNIAQNAVGLCCKDMLLVHLSLGSPVSFLQISYLDGPQPAWLHRIISSQMQEFTLTFIEPYRFLSALFSSLPFSLACFDHFYSI